MFEKLQKDFLSAMFKKKKDDVLLYCEDGETVYFSTSGAFFARLHREDCFIIQHDNPRHISEKAFTNFEKLEDADILTDTGIIRQTDKKIDIKILKTQNGDEWWINRKFLQYFTDNAKIAPISLYATPGTPGKTPVKVYCGACYIGAILPINHK